MLATTRAGRREVAACCARAGAQGVRAGMSLAQAGALVRGGLEVAEHEPSADASALRAAARWAGRWTPRVAVDGVDGLMLDMTGCDRLWGGRGRVAARVLGAMGRLGVEAVVGMAPTR
ncbi:MAG: DNA polymerase Y family protein, partial [Planctomycetota bacterium]